MHCFASENQTYTGKWLFGVESWKSLKGQENLLLKNLQVKTRVENVRFLSWRIFFVWKYGIQSTNEMAFKRTVTLRASFRFPAIRFDAPTLLSFSGFTHAHAKCPPVALNYLHQKKPEPIIHRDVSSANVLLWRQGDQWRGKVSDYGTPNFMQQTMTVAPGAMIYSAPEALTSNQTVKVSFSHCSRLLTLA